MQLCRGKWFTSRSVTGLPVCVSAIWSVGGLVWPRSSAALNLRTWSSGGDGWSPRWRRWSIDKRIDALQQWCRLCIGLQWSRSSWAKRQSAWIQAVKDEEGEEEIWLICSGSCQMDGWISVVCSYSSEEASVNAGVCVGSLMRHTWTFTNLSPSNFCDWFDIHLFSFLSLHLLSPRVFLFLDHSL